MTTPKERPILFSAEMVRAILDRRKTQTRRVVKPRHDWYMDQDGAGRDWPYYQPYVYADPEGVPVDCPYGAPGDRLWVRETFHYGWAQEERNGHTISGETNTWVQWVRGDYDPTEDTVWYAADGPPPKDAGGYDKWAEQKTPSIHMPRWASRILLEITGVRVERVQDISEDDVRAEGLLLPDRTVTMWNGIYRAHFSELWDRINAERGYPWDANPLVWVVEFRIIKPEATP